MVTLQIIPDGFIIDLLVCGILDHTDVVNFGATCKRFYALSNSVSVWKRLFLVKWSSFLSKTTKLRVLIDKDSNDGIPHWKVLYHQVTLLIQQLDKIYKSYFPEDHLNDKVYERFLEYCQQFSYEFVFAVLYDIVTGDTSVSLTHKYYAKKVFHYLQQQPLQPQLKNLTLSNDEESDKNTLSKFIQGAILIEQSFNPLDQYPSGSINNFIVEASEKTMKYLDTLLSSQPTDDVAKIAHLKVVALNHVFFEDLGFNNIGLGDRSHVNHCYIHKVIATRRGTPILYSIIYHEIAKRIDFPLEYVYNRGHFVLRWQVEELDSKDLTVSEIARAYRFIDVFNRGRLLHRRELSHTVLKIRPASITEVLHRVSRSVYAHSRISQFVFGYDVYNVRLSVNALNLCLLLKPNHHRDRAKRLQLLLNHNINHEVALVDNLVIPGGFRSSLSLRSAEHTEKLIRDGIKKKEKQRQAYKPTICLRSDERKHGVCYSVGMVMKHRRYDYVCLIRAWDPLCKMQDWTLRMIPLLERRTEQPFYHVLVDKEISERYVAEDDLQMIKYDDELDHREIGRYFSSTSNMPTRHYLPNSELELRYPDDRSFTQMGILEMAVEPLEEED